MIFTCHNPKGFLRTRGGIARLTELLPEAANDPVLQELVSGDMTRYGNDHHRADWHPLMKLLRAAPCAGKIADLWLRSVEYTLLAEQNYTVHSCQPLLAEPQYAHIISTAGTTHPHQPQARIAAPAASTSTPSPNRPGLRAQSVEIGRREPGRTIQGRSRHFGHSSRW